ncbi:MAG: alpha/beta hydrolase [Dehalococcoidia bacterium]|nr:alpha/beta hydrolase [Dehalococcoidia bacterium]MSQ17383.1 alpha/beta hydrolase [Dehalococcoidia bacterium]
MASHSLGLTLYQAARQKGVAFTHENAHSDHQVRVNGMKFHYLEWGNPANPTILMLHGGSQQAHSWDFVSLPLSEQFHIVALDQRGHGDSDWAADGDYSTEAHQRDIDGFVQAQGLRDFHLIGHSMGGRNSYVWASRHPGTLKSLVIVDTGPEGQARGRNRIQSFRELPDELDSLDEFASRVQEYTGRTREQVLGALKYSIRQRPDGKWSWKYDKLLRTPGQRTPQWTPEQLWEAVSRIDCPTLVMRGGDSDIFADATMRKMEQVIPQCTTVTVPKAGHLVAGDNPVDFLKAVRGLYQRVG